MPDVFISYSRHDAQLVRRLAGALRAAGKTVFVDIAELWRGRPAAAGEPALVAAAVIGTDPVPGDTAAGDVPATVPAIGQRRSDDPGAPPGPAGAGTGERAAAELQGIPPSARWLDEIKAGIAAALRSGVRAEVSQPPALAPWEELSQSPAHEDDRCHRALIPRKDL